MINYYAVLNIAEHANADEIKKAYRNLALKFHPDTNQGSKVAEERFKEIQEAYEILSDESKKKLYDENFKHFFNKSAKNQNENPLNNISKDEVIKDKEQSEKERIMNLKRHAALSFEDQAWIALSIPIIFPGLIGLFMFLKYRREGYIKKSQTVCKVTLISGLCFFIRGLCFFILGAILSLSKTVR